MHCIIDWTIFRNGVGGLMMFVSDTAAFEELEKSSVGTGTESPTNLFLSGSSVLKTRHYYCIINFVLPYSYT